MSTSTANLGLILPDYSDIADIEVLNGNFRMIDEAISQRLPLSGGTMTSGIKHKYNAYDLKQSNNGISSGTGYPYAGIVTDKNGHDIAFYGASVMSTGDVAAGMHSYNYNSSGTQTGHNFITVFTSKDGTLSYNVGSASAFRNAISANLNFVATESTTAQVANDTPTVIIEKSIGPGSYIIVGTASFSANSNGWRAVRLWSGAITSFDMMNGCTRVWNAGGVQTTLVKTVWLHQSASNELVMLNVRHNAGSTLNVLGRLEMFSYPL